MIRALTVAAVSGSCLLAASGASAAAPPPTRASGVSNDVVQGGVSVAGFLGYGWGGSTNPYGLSGGLRIGYTLPYAKAHFYLGGSITWSKGTSNPQFGLDVTSSVWYLGVLEAGYDFGLGPVLLRPYLGLGPAVSSVQTGNLNNDTTNFAVWPGLTALVGGRHWVAGLDARFLVNSGSNGPAIFATGGVRF